MKKYTMPEMEIVKLNVVDVITASGGGKEDYETEIMSVGGYDVVETADR